jgi:cullin 3
VNESFQRHPMFSKALKQAFEKFINADERVARQLAEYSNEVLKKGSRIRIENASLESVLTNIAYLYYYISDKDVFERAYSLFLQMRLLNSEFENEHSEKQMIAKLKHSNYQFTNRLEGMFKDMTTSKELLTNFLAADGKQYAGRIQLEVNVCTTSHWPRQDGHSRVVVPQDLKEICDSYKTFYLREHTGHRLDYRMEQGRADMSVWFHQDARPYILNVSTYQMILLLIFNEAVGPAYQIPFSTILDRTGLRQYEVSHHLLSMCHPKVKVLKKSPNTPELNTTDMLSLNPSYSNKARRVTIPTMNPPQVLKDREEKEAKARTIRRKNMMEAAIVRIMKARKKLAHGDLVAEVISQLSMRFMPTPSDVKRRIESLIGQNYLERLPNDRGTYQYMP